MSHQPRYLKESEGSLKERQNKDIKESVEALEGLALHFLLFLALLQQKFPQSEPYAGAGKCCGNSQLILVNSNKLAQKLERASSGLIIPLPMAAVWCSNCSNPLPQLTPKSRTQFKSHPSFWRIKGGKQNLLQSWGRDLCLSSSVSPSLLYKAAIRLGNPTLTGKGSLGSQFCPRVPLFWGKTSAVLCASLRMEQQEEQDFKNFWLLVVRPEELERRC